jgi:pilus assembly protein CpaE
LQQSLAGQTEFDVQTRLVNGLANPLQGVSRQPEILVLRLDAQQATELASWTAGNAAERPPLLVVGPPGQTEVTRFAVRAGARDFLLEPVNAAELLTVLQRVQAELRAHPQAGPAGKVHAIVGVAGGVGTSFVAANIARILVDGAATGVSVPMLVDLDLNFAPLAHYLDLQPERGLLQAMDAVDGLDAHALSGFGARHRSGLRVLTASNGPAVLPKEASAEKLSQLIGLMAACHPHVIVDTPHAFDALTATVFGLSSDVTVVLQQSLLHVRSAVRLMQILRSELGVSTDRVRIVVNRYQKGALVQLDDIRRSLDVETLLIIPSHYRSALESGDTGVPLYDVDRDSAVVQGLQSVAAVLRGAVEARRSGLLHRVLPSFLRN